MHKLQHLGVGNERMQNIRIKNEETDSSRSMIQLIFSMMNGYVLCLLVNYWCTEKTKLPSSLYWPENACYL